MATAIHIVDMPDDPDHPHNRQPVKIIKPLDEEYVLVHFLDRDSTAPIKLAYLRSVQRRHAAAARVDDVDAGF
jgi:hypothetical protein